MKLVLYSKPGCHLCEGLEEKLRQIPTVCLEVRDITTCAAWWQAYQLTIPVLCYDRAGEEVPLPRLSPRASVTQVAHWLQKSIPPDPQNKA
jgi:hypothetical protein